MATAFDFPAAPTDGQQVTLSGGAVVEWDAATGTWAADVPGAGGGPELSLYALKSSSVREASTSGVINVGDENNIVETTNTTPITLTLNTNATTPYTVGRSTLVIQKGTGSVTIVQGSGATVNVRDAFTLELAGQNAQVAITKTGTDEWDVSGDLTPS